MKKNNFMKDAIILFIITLIAGLSLGGVYEITKAPIKKAMEASKQAAYKKVFPTAEKFLENEKNTQAIIDSSDEISGLGFGNVRVDEVVDALDSSENVLGHVITATSKDGYGGELQLSVGVEKEGKINGIAFLSLNETPGLGMNAAKEEFYTQFNDKTVDKFKVVKVSPAGDDEIQAISGATITSSAVTNAVNTAVYFANYVIGDKTADNTSKKEAPFVMAFPGAEYFDEIDIDLNELNGKLAQDKGITIDKLYITLDEDNNTLGFMPVITSTKAYSKELTLAVGMNFDSIIQGIGFVKINETPGLGMKVAEKEFYEQYIDKSVAEFELALNGINKDSDIAAISGATITSYAVNQIINTAIGSVYSYIDFEKKYNTIERIAKKDLASVADVVSSGTENTHNGVSSTSQENSDAVSSNSPVVEREPLSDEEIFEEAFETAEAFEEAEYSKEDIDKLLKEKGFEKIEFERIVTALDSNAKKSGDIIMLTSKEAYHEYMKLAVGINTQGNIEGISFVDIFETQGLGMKVTEAEFYEQYFNKNKQSFELEEINSVSGATISTKAVNNLINAALYLSNEYIRE